MSDFDSPISDKKTGDIILKWFYRSIYAVGLITDSVIDKQLREENYVFNDGSVIDGLIRVLDNLCQQGYLNFEFRKSDITSGDVKCYRITSSGRDYIQSIIDDEVWINSQCKNESGSLDAIYMLDKTLEWFCMTVESEENIHKTFSRKLVTKIDSGVRIIEQYPEMSAREFSVQYDEILDKLVNDGYINVHGETLKRYSINIEGKFFNEKGGYSKQLKRESNRLKMQNSERTVLALGTIAAGIAGIWELFSDEIIRSVLISIFLAVLAALILPTISSIMKNR